MLRGSQSLCVSLGFLKRLKVDQMLPGLGQCKQLLIMHSDGYIGVILG